MTLKEAIKVIELVASHQPSVNMIVENDVFRLNAKPDAKYGVFAWLQGQHSTSIDSNTLSLQFTFFYVDRLTSDKGNQVEIQSVGIQTLDNILRKLDELGMWVSNYTFQAFNQRFVDECAGVFCNVTIDIPISSVCSDSFADFGEQDFNDDFMIY